MLCTLLSVNSGIHTAMYYYYLCAALGIKVWWKKYLTTAQIVQFVTGIIYVCINMKRRLLDGEPCTSNHWTGVFSTAVNCSFIVMFSVFFSKKYAKKDE